MIEFDAIYNAWVYIFLIKLVNVSNLSGTLGSNSTSKAHQLICVHLVREYVAGGIGNGQGLPTLILVLIIIFFQEGTYYYESVASSNNLLFTPPQT